MEFNKKRRMLDQGNTWKREDKYNQDMYEISKEKIFFKRRLLKILRYLKKLILILPSSLWTPFPHTNLQEDRFPKHAFFLSMPIENYPTFQCECFTIQRFPANTFIKFHHNKFIKSKISIQIFHSSLSLFRSIFSKAPGHRENVA